MRKSGARTAGDQQLKDVRQCQIRRKDKKSTNCCVGGSTNEKKDNRKGDEKYSMNLQHQTVETSKQAKIAQICYLNTYKKKKKKKRKQDPSSNVTVNHLRTILAKDEWNIVKNYLVV